MKTDWKHMTDEANRQSQCQDDSDFTIMVICILVGIVLALAFPDKFWWAVGTVGDYIWRGMDWVMTVEENFRR